MAYLPCSGTNFMYVYDDAFCGAPTGDIVNAQARFYEGLQLPSSFVPGAVPSAGSLPATPVNPNLAANSATDPVNRTWIAP